MPKGQKFGGRDFVKGHKSKGGRPRIAPEVREARVINANLFYKILSKYLNDTASDVNAGLKEKPTPNLERIILKIMDMATKGNLAAANIILERMIGKVPDELNMGVSGKIDNNVKVTFVESKKAKPSTK